MSGDRGHMRTMRLLPFTAAADKAAWVAILRHDRRQGASKSACRPGPVQASLLPWQTHRACGLTCSGFGEVLPGPCNAVTSHHAAASIEE